MTPEINKQDLCTCSHTRARHRRSINGKVITLPCTYCDNNWVFCKCKDFHATNGVSVAGQNIEEKYCEIAAKRLSQGVFKW